MTYLEKVIEGLKELSGFLFREYGKAQAEEASLYYDRFLTVGNAIALLKDQEPKIPIHIHEEYHDYATIIEPDKHENEREQLISEGYVPISRYKIKNEESKNFGKMEELFAR